MAPCPRPARGPPRLLPRTTWPRPRPFPSSRAQPHSGPEPSSSSRRPRPGRSARSVWDPPRKVQAWRSPGVSEQGQVFPVRTAASRLGCLGTPDGSCDLMAASTDRACDKARRSGILGAIVALSGVLASGCGSAVSNGLVDASSGADGSDGTAAQALPACTWPASLDDAAPRQCSAARAYVTCQYPGGASSACMRSDPTI